MQFQQKTDATIQDIRTQISQLTSFVSELKAQNSGFLPSQTIMNLRDNVSAITLRSGR